MSRCKCNNSLAPFCKKLKVNVFSMDYLRALAMPTATPRKKAHLQINICAIVTYFTIFSPCSSNRVLRSTLQLDCSRRGWRKKRNLTICCCLFNLSSKPQMWWFHVVILQRRHGIVLSACRTCGTPIFHCSTNQILDLWRCLCRWCHRLTVWY